MGRGDRNDEAYVADLKRADPVARGDAGGVESHRRLVEHLGEHLFRHRLVRLVLQAQHRASACVVARRPLEGDDGTVVRSADGIGHGTRVERRIHHSRLHTAAHRRIEREFVSAVEAVVEGGELLVDGDEVRAEVPRQRRQKGEQPLDRVGDGCLVRHLYVGAVGPGLFAVGGE